MRYRRINLLATASLSIFALVCASWWRSGYVHDVAWVSFGGRYEHVFRVDGGRVIFTTFANEHGNVPAGSGRRTTDEGLANTYPGPAARVLDVVAVELARGSVDSSWPVQTEQIAAGSAGVTATTFSRVRVYHPVLALAALLPTTPWVLLRRRLRRARHRTAEGRCPACAYDLRGSTGARCPECGTPTSQQAATGVRAGPSD